MVMLQSGHSHPLVLPSGVSRSSKATREVAPSHTAASEDVVIGARGQRMKRCQFERLRQRVLDRLDRFPGEIVTSKVLLGIDYWLTLKSPTLVGMAIAHMAAQGLLPIVRVFPFRSETCASYQLP